MIDPTNPLPVRWTSRAEAELAGIRAYIGQVNPLAAQRLASRLVAAAESLADHPARFRGTSGARELVAVKPYVIRYRFTSKAVTILRVRHGARRPLR